jgi:hypothetical protein
MRIDKKLEPLVEKRSVALARSANMLPSISANPTVFSSTNREAIVLGSEMKLADCSVISELRLPLRGCG